MVLTQLDIPDKPIRPCYRFHTTMVLTQHALCARQSITVPCFHTTMVLTQRIDQETHAEPPNSVSIPLWFLRNYIKVEDNRARKRQFPYHYGSYATQIMLHKVVQYGLVSIPLWFSRNVLPFRKSLVIFLSFHTTMVHTRAVLR